MMEGNDSAAVSVALRKGRGKWVVLPTNDHLRWSLIGGAEVESAKRNDNLHMRETLSDCKACVAVVVVVVGVVVEEDASARERLRLRKRGGWVGRARAKNFNTVLCATSRLKSASGGSLVMQLEGMTL